MAAALFLEFARCLFNKIAFEGRVHKDNVEAPCRVLQESFNRAARYFHGLTSIKLADALPY